jgi:hypothetical protein
MRAYLLIFGPDLSAGIILGWLACCCWRSWRHASAVIAESQHAADEQPVPYWPADPVNAAVDAFNCTWCRPRPQGRCSCSGRCGHIRCVAPRVLFTLPEQAFLDGRAEMPR